MVMELPMQVPMCDLDTEKTQLEESLLRCANFQIENVEKQMKEIAIKLFAVSLTFESYTWGIHFTTFFIRCDSLRVDPKWKPEPKN